MKDRFDIDQVIRILGLNIRADQADGGADFDVACNIARKKLWKIKEYEDLEEQGKLLKLPCKVGDRVWTFEEYSRGELTGEVVNFKVEKIEIAFDSKQKPYFLIDNMDFPLDCLGKTLFHSESKAESALQKINEMEGKE